MFNFVFYIFVRMSKVSRQSSRSPVLTRRLHQHIKQLADTDFEPTLSAFQPRVLLSLDINETMVPVIDKIDNQLFGESQIVDNLPFSSIHSTALSKTINTKRSLESSSSEQIIIKRRYQKIAPSNSFSNYLHPIIFAFFFLFVAIITQEHYCISYPKNISRCIDCQVINPLDLSMQYASCRFQYCRT